MFLALADCRIDHRYTSLLKYVYKRATAGNKFQVERGVHQCDTMSPKLFTTVLEYVFKRLKWEEMRFADDIVITADGIDQAQTMLESIHEACKEVGLKINFTKTQCMTNLVMSENISVDGRSIEHVVSYRYLGHEIRNIPICPKRKTYNQCILPVLTYGTEKLTLTKKRRKSCEMLRDLWSGQCWVCLCETGYPM